MKPSEQLQAAHDLIDAPEKWTKGEYARRANGNPIGACEENAACWCAVGALQRVGAYKPCLSTYVYLQRDAQRYGFGAANYANDHPATTWKQVRRAFRRAIKAARDAGE